MFKYRKFLLDKRTLYKCPKSSFNFNENSFLLYVRIFAFSDYLIGKFSLHVFVQTIETWDATVNFNKKFIEHVYESSYL